MPPAYADVIFPLRLGALTYAVPPAMQGLAVGSLVAAPMGRRILCGVVASLSGQEPGFRTRPLAAQVSGPVVTAAQLKLWNWIAGYYFCSLGEVLDAALPAAMKLGGDARLEPAGGLGNAMGADIDFGPALYADDRALLSQLQAAPKSTLAELAAALPDINAMGAATRLLALGAIRVAGAADNYKPLVETQFRLSEGQLETALRASSRAAKRAQALQALAQGGWMSLADLRRETGLSASVIRSALRPEWTQSREIPLSRLGDDPDAPPSPPAQLTPDQQAALGKLQDNIDAGRPSLLWGVTGSGKTEVYVELIRRAISQGKQALYLLPEIAISSQIIGRLRASLGGGVCVYHSKVSGGQRAEAWHKVRRGEIRVVVGPRSALFLPFAALGLVVVDEEHDPSYKQQDPAPRYNARDVALLLAATSGAGAVLGSATPSLESLLNARQGKYALVTLASRYGGTPMPAVEVVDYRKWWRRREVQAHLTPPLREAARQALEAGEQVILLQNRRGAAPFVQCPSCGHVPKCRSCDVSLTQHAAAGQLRCHYCGRSVAMPPACPQCGAAELRPMGFGTQTVEAELRELFPGRRVARLDADVARAKTDMDAVMRDFAQGDIDILVGTQMVSKGLDFGGVNLVGILNADNLTAFPDFRAQERAFQTITQFAGRAGRRDRQGRVIVQTSDPGSPLLALVARHDYGRFALEQLRERNEYGYPPFTRMITLTVSHTNAARRDAAADLLARMLTRTDVKGVVGPYTPVVERVAGRHIALITIKMDRGERLNQYRRQVLVCVDKLTAAPGCKGVRVAVDVDPY